MSKVSVARLRPGGLRRGRGAPIPCTHAEDIGLVLFAGLAQLEAVQLDALLFHDPLRNGPAKGLQAFCQSRGGGAVSGSLSCAAAA